MDVDLSKIFSPEVAAAIIETARRAAREEVDSRLPARPSGEEELTVKQVAELKGVKPKTVYEWKDRELLPFHTTPTGRVRFYRADVEAL